MLGMKDMYDIAMNTIPILDKWSHLKASCNLEIVIALLLEKFCHPLTLMNLSL